MSAAVPVGPEPLSPEREAEIREWVEAMGQQKNLRYYGSWQQHGELLGEIDRLRARVDELEAQAAVVAEFVADRANYIVAIRNCHPDNDHDYNRWQGHAESRRQLAEKLGLPVAWPPKNAAESADRLTRFFAPTQALREVSDGEHYQSVHHDYRTPHDLPETGGTR